MAANGHRVGVTIIGVGNCACSLVQQFVAELSRPLQETSGEPES